MKVILRSARIVLHHEINGMPMRIQNSATNFDPSLPLSFQGMPHLKGQLLRRYAESPMSCATNLLLYRTCTVLFLTLLFEFTLSCTQEIKLYFLFV
jgi:hypothetical protein